MPHPEGYRIRIRENKAYAHLKGLWDTRWTPNDEAFRGYVQVAIDEAGSRRQLCLMVNLKQRHLRRIMAGHSKAISYRIADQLLARSDAAYALRELPWYTVNELMEKGIWEPPFGEYYEAAPEAKEKD